MVDIESILTDKEMWEKEALEAEKRKEKLVSFGPNALGLLVQTEEGLFVVDPEDACVSQDLLNHGRYNRDEVEIARSFITAESRVLIVGAHLGTHALSLAKSCQKVIAIEANAHTFKLLEANVRLHQSQNIELHHFAAAESEKKIEFLLSRANSGGSKRKPEVEAKLAYVYDKPAVVEVDAKPLDSVFGEESFDLILMDIEGSEYFALQGMPKILEKTKVLALEYLPHHLKYVAGVSPKAFSDLLLPHFDWMYLPAHNHTVSPKEAIPTMLQQIYDADHCFENIYFIKGALPSRLIPKG